MARGRMISKVISLDEKVNALSNDSVRLLFTWLIPHLDCEGRMYGDPQTVKSIVFPQRSMDVRTMQKYLDELVESGLIQRYINGGTTYICFPNFKKHQIGLNKSKELPSQIPAPKTENLQNDSGNNPAQVKVEVKVKEETKEESSSLSKEDVIEVYKKEIAGLYEEESLSEIIEKDIEATINIFSAAWVIDAIQEAVSRKNRTWRYVTGILKNWKRYGKDADFPSNKGPRRIDPDKYIKGKYGHMVRR